MHLPTMRALLLMLSLMSGAASHAIPLPLQEGGIIDAAGLQAHPPRQASSYLEGLQALLRHDLEAAAGAFLRAHQDNPKAAAPLLGLAEVAYRRKDLATSGRHLQQAAAVEPENPHVQLSLGRYLTLTKQYDKAEKALVKATRLDPRMASAWIALGDFYATFQVRPREAVHAYQEVIRLEPNHAGAHYGLGMNLAKLGEYPEGEKHLRRSAQLEPGNPLPWLGLAQLQVKRGELDAASQAVTQALKLQPKLLPARELHADLLASRGDQMGALREYESLLREAPKLAEVQVKAGMLYQALGRLEEAKKAYRAAIEVNPKHALAFNNLAWIALEHSKDLAQAEVWAKQAVKLAPEVSQYHDTLGWVYRARGRTSDALNALERAARLAPKDATILYHLGVVQAEAGRTTQAIASLRQALAQAPSSPLSQQARELLAKLEGKRGN